jgi:hypothetical protein
MWFLVSLTGKFYHRGEKYQEPISCDSCLCEKAESNLDECYGNIFSIVGCC